MSTQCKDDVFSCPLPGSDGKKQIGVDFSGGTLTSDGGVVLLGLADDRLNLIPRLAGCFEDFRSPLLTVHPVEALVGQRLLALALGREDLNDHDRLRQDPAIGAVLGKTEPARSDCAPLAGKSTLNRLELSAAGAMPSKHRKIVADFDAMDQLLVDLFLDSRPAPAEIVLDLDSTDIPLHGEQEERFFHGYYREYCYMPLLVFCGRTPLLARLRSAAEDGAAGVEKDLARLVERIRQRWPHTHIILRTDSGFCREPILAWCESAGVDYVIGLARNRRLQERIAPAMHRSRSRVATTGRTSRRFRSFWWRTRTSWSRRRRVIAKAEVLPGSDGRRGKDNPRFLVTSLPAATHPAQKLYEEFYCARGDAENRVKEHKLHLFSKRCSSNLFDANALRFMFSTFSYVLIEQLRNAMKGTELERASPDTLRLRLLRIGGRVRKSVRRIHIALSSAFPDRQLFRHAWNALAPPAPT